MCQGIVRVCFYPPGELVCARDNFSKPDKISSIEKDNFRRSGKGLGCLGWMKLHLCREGGKGASFLSQKYALSWGPTSSQGRASGCPAGLGAGGASSRMWPWLPGLCTSAGKFANPCSSEESSPVYIHSSKWAFRNDFPTGIRKGFHWQTQPDTGNPTTKAATTECLSNGELA